MIKCLNVILEPYRLFTVYILYKWSFITQKCTNLLNNRLCYHPLNCSSSINGVLGFKDATTEVTTRCSVEPATHT